MKQIYCACLLIACAALMAACENSNKETAAPPSLNISATNNQNAANAFNQSFKDNRPADTSKGDSNLQSNAVAPQPEPPDFSGTAGITDKKYPAKGVVVLSEVRAAGHKNFDRIVFEFEGAETPSYHIEYIDKPARSCGSGDIVPLKGDGWLEIRFTPAAAHTEDGNPTVKNREQTPNLKIIKEIKSTCDFEAEVEWVLGVASANKYRVAELKNPTRLAIDIKH